MTRINILSLVSAGALISTVAASTQYAYDNFFCEQTGCLDKTTFNCVDISYCDNSGAQDNNKDYEAASDAATTALLLNVRLVC